MAAKWKGIYFDGKSAVSQKVEIQHVPEGIMIEFSDGRIRVWRRCEFQLQQDRPQGLIKMEHGEFPPEIIEVKDTSFREGFKERNFKRPKYLSLCLALLAVLLFLSMFLTGVAILVLVVPVIYPVSLALGIDPIHLGVLFALCIEMGAVIPPVGLNLFAVSGTTGVPVTTVMRGSFPFLCSDGCVLILCMLFPLLTLWLPNLVVKPIFG